MVLHLFLQLARSEARVRKRRPKAYPLMTKPRHELRKELQTFPLASEPHIAAWERYNSQVQEVGVFTLCVLH